MPPEFKLCIYYIINLLIVLVWMIKNRGDGWAAFFGVGIGFIGGAPIIAILAGLLWSAETLWRRYGARFGWVKLY